MTNHPPSVLGHCWLGHQTCKTRRPYNLYCVSADVKPCSIKAYTVVLRFSYPNSCNDVIGDWLGVVTYRKQASNQVAFINRLLIIACQAFTGPALHRKRKLVCLTSYTCFMGQVTIPKRDRHRRLQWLPVTVLRNIRMAHVIHILLTHWPTVYRNAYRPRPNQKTGWPPGSANTTVHKETHRLSSKSWYDTIRYDRRV